MSVVKESLGKLEGARKQTMDELLIVRERTWANVQAIQTRLQEAMAKHRIAESAIKAALSMATGVIDENVKYDPKTNEIYREINTGNDQSENDE